MISATSSDIEKAKNIAFLGSINNEGKFENENDMYGDSIDIAFLVLGKKAGIDNMGVEILGKIPYESQKRYSAVFYKVDATTVNQEDFSTKIGLNSLQSDGSVDSIGNYSYTSPAVRVF